MTIGIIGGGLIGSATAYYLSARGYKVLLFDKEREVTSASYGNAGMICPSHFTPLAAPGIIWQSIKWMLNNKSPLLFRPNFDPDFLRWGLAFFLNANNKNVNNHIGYLTALLHYSKQLYLELESNKVIPELMRDGIVMNCLSKHSLEEEIHLAKTAARLGIETNLVTLKDLEQLNPGVRFKGAGGVHYIGDMHTDPAVLMKSLKTHLGSSGVLFLKEEVNNYLADKNKLTNLITNNNQYKVDAVVVCAGISSPAMTKLLGDNVLIQGGKGYNITIPHATPQLKTPLILTESRVAVTPMGTNLRIGGTMEIGKPTEKIHESRLHAILENTETYLPDFKKSDLIKHTPWYGFRPLSTDGLPIMQPATHMSNVFINSGHGMLGLSLAPASGKIITAMIDQRFREHE